MEAAGIGFFRDKKTWSATFSLCPYCSSSHWSAVTFLAQCFHDWRSVSWWYSTRYGLIKSPQGRLMNTKSPPVTAAQIYCSFFSFSTCEYVVLGLTATCSGVLWFDQSPFQRKLSIAQLGGYLLRKDVVVWWGFFLKPPGGGHRLARLWERRNLTSVFKALLLMHL